VAGPEGSGKNAYLFNYARAKATEAPFVLLVEGPPDVLDLAEAGFVGVALLGSAAPAAQVRMPASLGKEVLLASESDGPWRSVAWGLSGE
jgi:DNA primase